mgnify:CR=1 FL=1
MAAQDESLIDEDGFDWSTGGFDTGVNSGVRNGVNGVRNGVNSGENDIDSGINSVNSGVNSGVKSAAQAENVGMVSGEKVPDVEPGPQEENITIIDGGQDGKGGITQRTQGEEAH